jgi:hypothetical protein
LNEEAFDRLPGTPGYAPGWNRTVVSRPVSIALSIAFSAGLLIVPLADFLTGSWQAPWRAAVGAWHNAAQALRAANASWLQRMITANRAALAGMKNFERELENSSGTVASVRPRALDFLLCTGAAGSEEAYVGKDGWLFYRPDVDALWRPGNKPDTAAAALAQFAADLAARGIQLVFVPVPGKATIHPEKFGIGPFDRPVLPDEWRDFAACFAKSWQEAAGKGNSAVLPAPVFVDATRTLWQRARSTGQAQFLRTDSHWTPGAMATVAAEVAGAVSRSLPSIPSGVATAVRSEEVTGIGDMGRMLELPPDSVFLRPETVAVRKTDSLWQPDERSPVLVLGDSYTNIYSADDLGWGAGAGFAEQISGYLGFPVDRLSRNDAGAFDARRTLAAEAARNSPRFQSKKVVVWQLAMRELIEGDWSAVSLPLQPAAKDRFLVAPEGGSLEVFATIRAIGSMPRVAESPYADFLTAVHLGDLEEAVSGKKLDADAFAYVLTMRDRRLLPTAGLVAGSRVHAKLVNYQEDAARLEQLNRSELEDVELMLKEPNFAEWITPLLP